MSGRGGYTKTVWIEKPLTLKADGLGAAEVLNKLMAGGLMPLEFRLLRLDAEVWLLLVKVGEKQPAKEAETGRSA